MVMMKEHAGLWFHSVDGNYLSSTGHKLSMGRNFTQGVRRHDKLIIPLVG
jgi:hypothetical protein